MVKPVKRVRRILRWGLNPVTAVTPHVNNPSPKPVVIWRPKVPPE